MKKHPSLHSVLPLQEVQVGNGIKLRLLEQSDAPRILAILDADKDIREKVKVASLFHTPKDIAAEIKRYKSYTGLIRYVLVLNDNPIGMVSFWRDDGFWGKKNLDDYGFGYFLDPKERGKGLITRAIQKLMETATKSLVINQFVAFCEDKNEGSIAVLTKLGFQPTDITLSEPSKGWIERKYIKPIA